MLVLLLALGLTISVTVSQIATPEYLKLIVIFDPDTYIWDSPLPDSWVAYIRPTSGYKVTDVNLSTILLEYLYKPISLQVLKIGIKAFFEPLDVKTCIELKMAHMGIPPDPQVKVYLGISAQVKNIKAYGEDFIEVIP